MQSFSPQYTDELDKTLKAIANPIRRAIIEQVAEKACTVNELAEQHFISLPAISQHLRILEDAGLITQSIKGRVRKCHLEHKPISMIFSWLVYYNIFWNDFLDDMTEELEAEQTTY